MSVAPMLTQEIMGYVATITDRAVADRSAGFRSHWPCRPGS
jgi:hypothetical protein